MRTATHPENTNDIERAERATVGLDHAEHAVELPAEEENNEKMVGVPKLFKPSVGPSPVLLDGKVNHDTKGGGHDPARDTGSSGEVEDEELNWSRRRIRDLRIDGREHAKIPHVSGNVDKGEDDNGPGSGDVELDVIVEWNDIVQGRLAEEGDEVSADWEKDEDDIEMEDERGGTGDCWTRGVSTAAQRGERGEGWGQRTYQSRR